MQTTRTLPLFLMATMLFAQSEHQYHEWMESVRSNVSSLRKAIEAKDQSAAVKNAKELQEIFTKVRSFWEEKKITDAIRFSTAAQGAFEAVENAAAKSNFDGAGAELKQAMSNCAGCHNAHREKTDGGFKIKY